MPFRLRISNEEVKSELVAMGYTNLNEEIIEEFRKGLLKLIKDDLKNIKKLKKLQESRTEESSNSFDSIQDTNAFSNSTPLSNLEHEKEKLRSPAHSCLSEATCSCNSDSFESISATNVHLRWKNNEGEASSSCEEIKETSSETNSLKLKVKDPPKNKDCKDKDLPPYPDRPDPVNLYHFYKAHWDKYKVPGEDPRSALRWQIRSQLFYSS